MLQDTFRVLCLMTAIVAVIITELSNADTEVDVKQQKVSSNQSIKTKMSEVIATSASSAAPPVTSAKSEQFSSTTNTAVSATPTSTVGKKITKRVDDLVTAEGKGKKYYLVKKKPKKVKVKKYKVPYIKIKSKKKKMYAVPKYEHGHYRRRRWAGFEVPL
ncbi:hypothetical protein GZH46_00984 [Fragariocoptes setiger]|uniref:Uncharacterized protein n=1 Tax=Fragariocoptes setiger TaxID=1670756 RepID=A0ABQ7SAP5_9ACAR|nr:hypothetical protein GZH46_00984 [Fragariocoptes setiger]